MNTKRIGEYWLGGKDNYAADPVAAREVIEAMPNILPTAQANRAFLRRAVQYLAGEAARTLDLSQPVAVIMLLVMHFIPDDDGPHQIASALMDAEPPGSYLVMPHGTLDFDPGGLPGTDRYNARVTTQMIPRPRAEITRFFDGLELLEPGLVPLAHWRAVPAAATPGSPTPRPASRPDLP